MKCERLHAIISVRQCLRNQKPDPNTYERAKDGSQKRPQVPNCWKCPTGEAARKGELNDEDINSMKQRILNGMRAAGPLNHPAERESNVGGLNTGVTQEMKQKAKSHASKIMEHRNLKKTSGRADIDEILEEVKLKTSDEVLEEIMQAKSEAPEMVQPAGPGSLAPEIPPVEEVQEQYRAEPPAPENGIVGWTPYSERSFVCSECGEPFETYKRGSTTVTRICLPCLKAKINKSRTKYSRRHHEAAPVEEPIQPIVVDLDFTQYPELFQSLSDSAIKDFRTPAMQALFLIKQILEDHHAAS